MTTIKPSAADQDFQNWVQQSSSASRQPTESTAAPGASFADQLALAKTDVSPAPTPVTSSGASSEAVPATYIPSSGQGDDKNVHHRLPDGTPVTYDDIRRAVAEGRGDEDVSPYFTGQTNAQALAAHGFAESIEQAPRLVGGVAAVATRSWLSLLSSITDTFGFGEKIRTAMADDTTNAHNAKPKSLED
ncbi:MAG: hypothetical protein RL446_610 [Pseudomonadota bacterium]|jgi:hypothetical protein